LRHPSAESARDRDGHVSRLIPPSTEPPSADVGRRDLWRAVFVARNAPLLLARDGGSDLRRRNSTAANIQGVRLRGPLLLNDMRAAGVVLDYALFRRRRADSIHRTVGHRLDAGCPESAVPAPGRPDRPGSRCMSLSCASRGLRPEGESPAPGSADARAIRAGVQPAHGGRGSRRRDRRLRRRPVPSRSCRLPRGDSRSAWDAPRTMPGMCAHRIGAASAGDEVRALRAIPRPGGPRGTASYRRLRR